MRIVFTKHAENMLVTRNIPNAKVIECVKDPDITMPGKLGKKIFLKDFGKNYLKVIVSEEDDKLYIITVYWLEKSKLKK